MSFKEFFHITNHSDSPKEQIPTEIDHINVAPFERCQTLDEACQIIRKKRGSESISPLEEVKLLAPFLEQDLISNNISVLRKISDRWGLEEESFLKALMQAIANIGVEKGMEVLHNTDFQNFAKEKGVQSGMLEIFSGILHDSKKAA